MWQKHLKHRYEVRPVTDKKPHKYQAYCFTCNKHIKWATEAEYRTQQLTSARSKAA